MINPKAHREDSDRLRFRDIFKPSYLALYFILLVASAIRLFHLSDPLGGYHGFNEAFYAIETMHYLKTSIWLSFLDPPNLNYPPLINLLMYASYTIFGVSEFSGRLMMAVSSVLAVLYLYKLGKVLYSEKIGLGAAALLAISPGFLLSGRNIQIEGILIFLIIAGLYYYVLSTKNNSLRFKIIAAIIFGLGILAKTVVALALIALLIWELIRQKNIKFLLKKEYLIFVATFFIVSLPWYLYQVINNQLLQSQQNLASAAFSYPDAWFFLNSFIPETMWALSPVIFVLFPIAIYFLVKEHKLEDILLLICLLFYSSFYLFFHFHSYYLIPITPFVLLAVSRLLFNLIESDRLALGILGGLFVVSFFFAILLMSGNKYGQTEFGKLPKIIDANEKGIVTESTDDLWGSYNPLISYYLPNAEVLKDKPIDFPKNKKIFLVDFDVDPANMVAVPSGYGVVKESRVEASIYTPVVFGYNIFQQPYGVHFFRAGGIVIQKTNGPIKFGLEEFKQIKLIVRELEVLTGTK